MRNLTLPHGHYHCLCIMHLKENFASTVGEQERKDFAKMARSNNRSDVRKYIDRVREASPDTASNLWELRKQWCRAYMPEDVCRKDYLASILVEVTNSAIKRICKAKRQITGLNMFVLVCSVSGDWFTGHQERVYEGYMTLTRAGYKLYKRAANVAENRDLVPRSGVVTVVGKSHTYRIKRDLKCKCGGIEERGIPCWHSIAAAKAFQVPHKHLCAVFWRVETHYKAYDCTPLPTPSMDQDQTPGSPVKMTRTKVTFDLFRRACLQNWDNPAFVSHMLSSFAGFKDKKILPPTEHHTGKRPGRGRPAVKRKIKPGHK
ncbi:hypothetical protein KIPB_013261 [Kipferlia bialata]|uniref:SWIM-type domain-containing protein n=1 Tax=Kipferlia bialata TaxID=797122 RepID=A0A9K3DA40_9EUKA|nr:hypothetical protein KIPB_013261 [Kipferlia bialata]|eukprot:g13261.t1